MDVRFILVDAFTETAFAGNPAAVCLLSDPWETGWMQAVARELNQPATAFLSPERDGFALRWFSPATELALCGHGTLASAHVLWEEGIVAPTDRIRFQTGAGVLACAREEGWIAMDFPAEPPQPVEPPEALVRVLGDRLRFVGRNRFDYLVELESAEAVQDAAPDLGPLAQVPTRGVILTALSRTDHHDFVSRFFAPSAGIGEDHVTGSAHCCLGPFWGSRLGRTALTGYQASPRGGTVRVRLRGERIELSGQAKTMARGAIAG